MAKMIQHSLDSRSFRDYPPPVAYVYRRKPARRDSTPLTRYGSYCTLLVPGSRGRVRSPLVTEDLEPLRIRSLLIAPIQCGLKALRTDHRPVLCGPARTKVRLYCELSSFFGLWHIPRCSWERSHKPCFSSLLAPFLDSVRTRAEEPSLSVNNRFITKEVQLKTAGLPASARNGASANPSQSNQPTNTNPAVQFDASNLQSSYANVCNVSSTREEVVLAFGVNNLWGRGQANMQVQMTNRIVLNPYAAKRLAIVLNRVVAEYESRFGALKDDTKPQADSA